MTRIDCGACGASNDAPLCRDCTTQLADTLRKLPGLIEDLATAATRQARLPDTHTEPIKVSDEQRANDTETANLPARLRSPHRPIALPSTALPVAFAPAALHRQAIAGVVSWTRAAGVAHHPSSRTICARLIRALDRVRKLDAAPEIHARALELAASIEATVDRPRPDVFAYRCDVAGCGTALYARPGEATVECPKCGTGWDVAERQSVMDTQLTDRLGTVTEVARYLRRLDLDVTVHAINGWITRGRVTDHGGTPRLVRIGEVRAYAQQQAARRASA